MASDMFPFDSIDLLGLPIPFADSFSFVNSESGEWPEIESSRMMEPQVAAPLPANSSSRQISDDVDVEVFCIKQSKRWRKASFHHIVGARTKLESSSFEDSDDPAVASTDSLMLLHCCAQSTHAPRIRVSASLARHTRNSTDAFTPCAYPFSQSKEDADVGSYGNCKFAKLSYQQARASPSLFELGPQMPVHHFEHFSYNAACKSVSFSTLSRMEGEHDFVHPLPVVLSASNGILGRTRLNAEQAINIFHQRATKTKHTAALLAAEYGISSKAIRDIWTRKSWVEDTRPFWTHLDEESSLSNP